MISKDLLRRLRNDLPMPVTIAALGREGPPSKMSEGYFRFLCPHCGEMRATVNPRNNLAHCFCCQKNLNNIDLLLNLDYDFRSAVALLERYLNEYQAQQAKGK
jgi:DNA primase